jgi:hypothetical protein
MVNKLKCCFLAGVKDATFRKSRILNICPQLGAELIKFGFTKIPNEEKENFNV